MNENYSPSMGKFNSCDGKMVNEALIHRFIVILTDFKLMLYLDHYEWLVIPSKIKILYILISDVEHARPRKIIIIMCTTHVPTHLKNY